MCVRMGEEGRRMDCGEMLLMLLRGEGCVRDQEDTGWEGCNV